MNLNNVMIGTEDPDRLIAYYTKVFGEPAFSDGGFTSWQLGEGSIAVGAHSEVHGKNAQPGRIIMNIETTDVRGEFDRLVAAGAIVVAEPYDFPDAGPEGYGV